jgi:hypothetical protein
VPKKPKPNSIRNPKLNLGFICFPPSNAAGRARKPHKGLLWIHDIDSKTKRKTLMVAAEEFLEWADRVFVHEHPSVFLSAAAISHSHLQDTLQQVVHRLLQIAPRLSSRDMKLRESAVAHDFRTAGRAG